MKRVILGMLVLGMVLSVGQARAACLVSVSGPPNNRVYQLPPPSGSDDTEQIQCGFDAMIADIQSGAATYPTIRMQAGATYQTAGQANTYAAIFIETKNLAQHFYGPFIFDGQGSTLLLIGATTAFYMDGCEGTPTQNCVFKNLTVAMSPTPFVEGTLRTYTASDLKFIVSAGHPFVLPLGWTKVVGKNAGLVIASNPDSWAFPNGLRFTSDLPYTALTSAAVNGTSENLTLGPDYPPPVGMKIGQTQISAIGTPQDSSKEGNVDDLRTAEIPDRMAYPEYGPVFFTGQPNAAIFFENNGDLSVSNVTVSDYPGNGIIANFNRGSILNFDSIKVIPSPGLRTSAASSAFTAHGNEVGPTLTNSIFIGIGDDIMSSTSGVFTASNLSGASATLKLGKDSLLGGSVIRAGDVFRITNSDGSIVQTNTVASAVPVYVSSIAYAWNVIFTATLPSGASSSYFVDTTRLDTGMFISNNAFIESMRGGAYWQSNAAVSNNLFVGTAKSAVDYVPFTNAHGNPLFGDYGKVNFRKNVIIDSLDPAFRLVDTGVMPPSMGALTFTNNSIYASNTPALPFYAVEIDTAWSIPTTATVNLIVTTSNDSRTQVADFLTGSGDKTAWASAFRIVHATSAQDLHDQKCAAVQTNPLWTAALAIAAPGMCP